ncbi:MAG: terminase, partial [Deltaproteobacteria bacterium]|nr:terminase [Deltaproteobacteria bacterium]
PVIRDSKNKAGDIEPPRVAIRSSLAENKILLIADPGYVQRIKAAARNEAELAAWIDGSWDITCGGMLDDLWDRNIHIIEDIPFLEFAKARWTLNRAYDHGQSRPFSVGWFAESNGIPMEWNGKIYGPIKGDIVLFAEWYGCVHIVDREKEMGLKGRIKRGPADSQIFARDDGKTSPAGHMKKKRIFWDKCDKSKGSRCIGWQQIRDYLSGALGFVDDDGKKVREHAGLFVCERNEDWLRTVPCLPRDDKNLDDVNTKVEDHAGDMTRYRLRWTRKGIRQRNW